MWRHTLIASIDRQYARTVTHHAYAPIERASEWVCMCVVVGECATRKWEKQILLRQAMSVERKKRATNCRLETFLEFDFDFCVCLLLLLLLLLLFFLLSHILAIRFEWGSGSHVVEFDLILNIRFTEIDYSQWIWCGCRWPLGAYSRFNYGTI